MNREKASREKAKGKNEKSFMLEMKLFIHDLGRTVHLKILSASEEEPLVNFNFRSPAVTTYYLFKQKRVR